MIVESAKEKKISDTASVIYWQGDIGFGQLSIKVTPDGNYVIKPECLSLESVAWILKKWIETKD